MSVSTGTEAPPYEVNSREGDHDEVPRRVDRFSQPDLRSREEEAPAV